ncbi:MAG: hypothetical protein ACLFVG_10995 [Candidatus Aminicenantes bacterium]
MGFVLFVFLWNSFAGTDFGEWSVRIGVKSDNYRDSYNFFGVSRESSLFYDKKDIPEPPPSPTGLCLYFPHLDWPLNPGRYAADFRSPVVNKEEYKFVVESGKNNRLTLFWLDLENAPKIYRYRLVDEEKSLTVDMSELSEYTYDCSPGKKRSFRIIVERRFR